MRIAYIASYQVPALMKTRPIRGNLALAANLKIELIAELLQSNGHDVEILSQGEVVEGRPRLYPSFGEKTFKTGIPVFYASALPARFVNGAWSSFWTVRLFKQRHQAAPYDIVLVDCNTRSGSDTTVDV